MGQLLLGRLAETKRWKEVVALLRAGSSVAELADAAAHAAESEWYSAKGDPGLGYTIWLLTQLPFAARSPQFAARLGALGFDVGAEQPSFGIVADFTKAGNQNVAARNDRTDLDELARSWSATLSNRLSTSAISDAILVPW